MDFETFRGSVGTREEPDSAWSLALQALWWEAKGDWEKAHELAQAASGPAGDWVHAYLHRKEGDMTNASYWYRRANQPFYYGNVKDEWAEIATALLE